jgi:hypothetical protein
MTAVSMLPLRTGDEATIQQVFDGMSSLDVAHGLDRAAYRSMSADDH